MTDYTKTTNFTAKDSLPVGNANKKINGSLFDTEFDNIATAIATKANAASPSFTGTVTSAGVISVDDTTDSTSGTTGSIHTDGGIGAVKDIVAGATVKALGDTAAGDAAAMGYTATEGLILTGQGSTYDVTIKNDADQVVAGVPTGTQYLDFIAGFHLGGTGAANLLDDYETSTWTIELADAATGGNTASIGSSNAEYVKIGKLVHVVATATNIDTTGMTGGNALYIRGLPFTIDGGNNPIGSVELENVTFSGIPILKGETGAARATVTQVFSAGASSALTVAGVASGTGDISFSLTYKVA